MKITTVINESDGLEYVSIDDENGNFISMLKSTWEELEAQKELGGTL